MQCVFYRGTDWHQKTVGFHGNMQPDKGTGLLFLVWNPFSAEVFFQTFVPYGIRLFGHKKGMESGAGGKYRFGAVVADIEYQCFDLGWVYTAALLFQQSYGFLWH